MRFVDRVLDPFSRAFEDAARYYAAKQQRARDYGFAQVVYAAIMGRLARLGFQLFLVELGDDRPDIAMPRLPPGYTAQPIDLEDLRPWVGRDGYDLSAAFLQGAIQRGDRCVANFYHGELVGYGFVTCVGAPATRQLQVAIDDRLVYRYKGWTHPDHRRKHLSHARGRLNRQFFPLTDGRRTVAFVDVANLAAKLQHADIHPVRLGYCGYVRVWGREFPFTQRVPRRFGFRLVRSPVDYSPADYL